MRRDPRVVCPRVLLLLATLAGGARIFLFPSTPSPTGGGSATAQGAGALATAEAAPPGQPLPPAPPGPSAGTSAASSIGYWRIGVTIPSIAPHLAVPIYLRLDRGNGRFEGRAFGANFKLTPAPGTGSEARLASSPEDPGRGVRLELDGSLLEAAGDDHPLTLSVGSAGRQTVTAHRVTEGEWSRVRYRGAVQGAPRPASPLDAAENEAVARHLAAELWIDLPVPPVRTLTDDESVRVGQLVADAVQRGLATDAPHPRVRRSGGKLIVQTTMADKDVEAYLAPILAAGPERQVSIAEPGASTGEAEAPGGGEPRPRPPERDPRWPGASLEAFDDLPISDVGRSFGSNVPEGVDWPQFLMDRWAVVFPSMYTRVRTRLRERLGVEWDATHEDITRLPDRYRIESTVFNVRDDGRLFQRAHVLILTVERLKPVATPRGQTPRLRVTTDVLLLTKARSEGMETATKALDPRSVVAQRDEGAAPVDSNWILELALKALRE